MRILAIVLVAVGVGCASSDELAGRANARMASANDAASRGDYGRARSEQKQAEHLYQRAASRAWEEGKTAPEPPSPTPLPVFEPQMER